MHPAPPERAEFAADFRIGGWLVEPSLDRLSRDGTVVRLRPQLTNLLVVLAEHAGQTVPKDTILAEVWEGQHVAESGMTRCIAEIRQALGDDAHEPTIVQTIPKRGYRLVAPVEFLEKRGLSGDDGNVPAVPAVMQPADSAQDSARSPSVPWRRRRRNAVIVGLVLGAALAVAWEVGGWNRTPVLSERDTVVLADVTNTTGDSAFDGTLRLALAVNLGQSPSLHILSSHRVRSALTLMGKSPDQPMVGSVALEVCRREGAAVLLAGSIARLGSNYAVGIEAIDCRSGESIDRALREVTSKEQVLTELGAAAAELRRTLGESLASLERFDVPIVQATTPSLEALKALSLGDLNRDHARPDDALTFYRRAVELDPQFALAWARLGAAAAALGRDEETIPAIRRAYELRGRVSEPERFYILGHYYRFVTNEPDKAIETYMMWKRIYPGSAVPPTNLASVYVNTFGQYETAVPEAIEAVRLAPYSSLASRMLVLAYLGTNRVPDARQAMREAASRGVDDVVWHCLAFQMAFTDGDTTAMQEHVRWADRNPAATLTFTQHRALAAASVGRLREARQLWSEAVSTAAQIAPPVRQAGIRAIEAEAEALLGDPQRARVAAEAALAVNRQPDTVLSAAIAFALAGDTARAATLLAESVGRVDPGVSLDPVWLSMARALVEAGAGRSGRAREILGETARFERCRDHRLAPLGVRASIELSVGRSKEAAATFEEMLRLRRVVPLSPWVAFARLGLARALRDAGDVGANLAAYDSVLDSMKAADADAPLLVAARRERAALAGR
jgi:DNA-binding winged helix-turn-helix (wHTH) protein/tetratricopeptide (TPR) repeat protein